MKGLMIQLKNIRRDKMCILSFLLPVIVGLAINLMSGVSFSTIGETAFGVVENDLTGEMMAWLEQNGSVTVYKNIDDLQKAVIEPATQMIGVVREEDMIRTILSGDELQLYRTIGDHLPCLFAERDAIASADIEVRPSQSNNEWLKSMLVVITMLTAMFMGCTFNAMSIIGEKEDGILFINEILPMTQREYVLQKIMLGLAGGVMSTAATALVCMRITAGLLIPLLLIIMLSALISALTGLVVGQLSSGLMVGIVYIKIIMIVFIAPPILFYLVVPEGSIIKVVSYIFPSSATFYGLMDLMSGQVKNIGVYLMVLVLHCIMGFFLYLLIGYHQKGKVEYK